MKKKKKERSSLDRSNEVWNYAASLELIGASDEGRYVAPPDIRIMLEHRLRAALRDGPCPECPNCSLHAALEEATLAKPA